MPDQPTLQRIVIAGGGAGGLELAARLGRRFGPARVFLIDRSPFHIWKPSLHEVAAGTLDIHQEGLSYRMLGHINGFSFVPGSIASIDRQAKRVQLAPLLDEQGVLVLPERSIPYDGLVLALGSLGNFFGTPGAEEHAIALDTTASAEHFRATLLRAVVRADDRRATGEGAPLVHLVIVGGGATGVELAAELRDAGNLASDYTQGDFDPMRDISITVVEVGPRLLGPLPERVSTSALAALQRRRIRVETDTRIAEVRADSVLTADGRVLPADLCVWAAGISAPTVLRALELPLNRVGQIVVDAHLATPDPAVFALGDCAAAPRVDAEGTVPARAQAAHQQAAYLAKRLGMLMRGGTPDNTPFRYTEHGSLVSLGTQSSVGSLMGGLMDRGFFVSGLVARLMYMSLHLMHHYTVLGLGRTISLAFGRLLLRRTHPRVKLH
ncbi:NAD(P)/FAD-dependent oxidoreductase [Verticiella sediminum]|uniref:NAD(P)/FAD-dependent oxidoreductase n=2 Tax=Verticiella sediminum TaxID=1247510 RepID=A0A556ADU9_9BURK|nr:FAD-dependent oxidoreductase [Verticiella sediminum]TSH91043.1 NAD(P)/FAD-dependent oxidoreductase [Verticiella sediminum]